MTWLAIRAMLGTAWGFLKSIPWRVWLFVGLVALALLYGENRADAREELVREEYDARDAAAADALEKINAANRAETLRKAEQMAAIGAKHEEEKARAIQETRDSVLAELRSGKLRLRIPFGGCPARSGQATASAGIGDDAAEVSGAYGIDLAVADSIALAAEADAYVKACQATITAYRGPQ